MGMTGCIKYPSLCLYLYTLPYEISSYI